MLCMTLLIPWKMRWRMKKSSRTIRYIFAVVVLLAWISLTGVIVYAAEPFELHLLDVGQGQCVLLEADDHYMLIDGGGRSSSSFVVSYLKQQGIDHFDLVAVSHYDEDHMSGVIGALSVFPANEILLPSYAGEGELYQSLSTAAVSNGAVILHPFTGEEFSLGGATVEVVGPVRTDYEWENDRSLAFRITYCDVSCLVCGDAEGTSEWDMVNSGRDISADIYVVNHHGSRTSSTEPFLDVVSPSYALISCGKDNSYGHPAAEVLQCLQERGMQMYRTDLQGTVILYSDGYSIWADQELCQDWTPGKYEDQTRQMPVGDGSGESGDAAASDSAEEALYVCNTNTMKFHYPSCDSVKQMKESNRVNTNLSRDELIAQGYQPCGNCHP